MDTDAGPGARLSAAQASGTRDDVGGQAAAEDDARASVTAADIGAERLASDADYASDAGDAGEIVGDGGVRPTVESQAWLKQDDYWQRTTYIAVTGRHTAAAPPTRPLPRPHRFRKSSRVRSILVLALTLALIVVIPMGVVMAQRAAETHITLPTGIPGLTEPTQPIHTPTPTATIKPTVTPKKK
jgi:hypothetical protein